MQFSKKQYSNYHDKSHSFNLLIWKNKLPLLKISTMFLTTFWPFYQFLWTLFFLVMFIAGFWCIFFFATFVVPIWLTEGVAEYLGKINRNFDPEKIRYCTLPEQDGVQVIYTKNKE